MAVHPEYQRRGIGALLTKAGIEVAERSGLPIYLESSKEGVALYNKLGFRELKERIVHNKEALKAEEDYVVPLMVWVSEDRKGALPRGVELKSCA